MRVQSRGAMESGARSANGDGCFFFANRRPRCVSVLAIGREYN